MSWHSALEAVNLIWLDLLGFLSHPLEYMQPARQYESTLLR